VTLPRSKVERLARNLRNLAILLLVVWLVAAGAAIAWVSDEFQGDADVWRYITAVADVSTFLIASVLAYVGSAAVQAIGRVRSSIISAMFEQANERELEQLATQPTERPVDW
jgi:hypothetical protein